MVKLGTECEGIYSGLVTLFIGAATNQEIFEAIRDNKFQHIYVGADYYEPTWEQVKYIILTADNKWPITMELPISKANEVPLDVLYKISSFILRVNIPEHHIANFSAFKKVDQIKIETKDACHLVPIGMLLVNQKHYLDKPISQ